MLYRLIFLSLSIIINLISLYAELRAYKLDQINILYTRIPTSFKDKKDFLDLVKKSKKNCIFFYIILTVFVLNLAIFFDSISLMILDILVVSLVRPFLLQKDIDKIREYKNKYGKKIDKLKVIDFDLIEKRKDLLVKKSSYFVVLFIYLVSVFIGIFLDKIYPNIMWLFLMLSFCGSDIFIDWLISKRLIKTYTSNSATNLRLNEEIGKKQSILLYRKSLINSILFLIFVLICVKNPYSIKAFIIYMLLLTINIAYSFIKFDKIRNNPILNNQEISILEDDEDYYTAWGYNNPDDNRLFVNRLYGMGSELNIGKLSGKLYYLSTIVLMLILLIFVSYISSTPTNYSYQIKEDRIELSSNMFYKDTIYKKDIEKISLLDHFPKGRAIRIAGNALEKTSTGSYRIEGYGSVRLYIYKDSKKVVEIRSKDKKFLFNENSDEKTEKLYKKLVKFFD
ncbi:MAG: hypothetical protein PUG67_03090 [Peptoniphilaceae bacterium]|nr:hypothetical protein [Peptoniphilaceae bacterium]MDY6018822.1 hypothetical protein [Anaerococcus sp.]